MTHPSNDKSQRRTIRVKRLNLMAAGLVCLLGVALWLRRAQPPQEPHGNEAPASGSAPSAAAASYAGSGVCGSCHEAEFRAWRGSHHAHAERQLELPADVTAFDAKTADAYPGAVFHAGVAEPGPFVEVQGASGKLERLGPVRWIGVDPLRQLLIQGEAGRLQALDVAYDPAKRDWFSIFGNEQRQPGEWGHFTGRGMNWNSNCASCHNTDLRKGYQPENESYQTTYQELGVGCESCHGPQLAHVEAYRNQRAPAPHHAAALTAERWLDTCGSCHSRRSDLTGNFRPGHAFADDFALEIPGSSAAFYADGQVNEEAYELTSFLSSRMHQAGVTCQDCHEPHSSQLRFPDDQLCLQCHGNGVRNAPRIDPAAHTFHKPSSTGSRCVNCHMPLTRYMQRHGRRDHGFTIPDPLLTLELGIPNACNRCHADKSAAWAEHAAALRYGQRLERATRRRARLLAKGEHADPSAKKGLLELLSREPIGLWRAAAAAALEHYLPDQAVVSALLEAAHDDDALTRERALRALELEFPREPERIGAALRHGLEDPLRSVRVAAAWALRAEVSESSQAGADLLAALRFNQDQPTGQLQLGGYQLARGNVKGAIDHLERAVRWDTRSAPLHHELAVALSAAGRTKEAIAELERARTLEPAEGQYAYRLGLAYSENHDLKAAIETFELAVKLSPQLGRAWYNLGLARNLSGDASGGLRALEQAERAAPLDADVPYARAVVLSNLQRKDQAKAAAQRALSLNPTLQAARALLHQLSQ